VSKPGHTPSTKGKKTMSYININGFIEEVVNDGVAEILVRRIRKNNFHVCIGSLQFETGKITTNDLKAVIGYYLHEAIEAANKLKFNITVDLTHQSKHICSVEFTRVTNIH
jgi:ribosomal protein L1